MMFGGKKIFANIENKKTVILLIVAVSIVVVAALAVGIYFIVNPSQIYSFSKKSMVYRDVTISNMSMQGLTDDEALSKVRSYEDNFENEYKLTVEGNDKSIILGKSILDFSFDSDDVLKKAKKSTSGASYEIKTLVSVNNQQLSKSIEDFAKQIDIEAVDPEVKAFDFDTLTFTVSVEAPGYMLNVEKTKSLVKDFFENQKDGTIDAVIDTILPNTTKAELQAHLGQVGTFSTECKNVAASEANMRLAMQLMNKKVVEPGGVFSFHETVGDSTTEAGGWVKSGAYRDGKLVPEYGGGICQAATTMYSCGLVSNMEVVERYCHLQPSSYCKPGLDATVDYPYVDTKMKNTTAYPIYVVSGMDGKILTMTMYGYVSDDYDKITIDGWYTGTSPKPDTEYEVDPTLKDGEYVLQRSGYTGYTAEAKRTWLDKDGNVIKEEALPSSIYSAVSPLYKIGNNTDTSKIPAGSESGIITPRN